MRRIRRFVRERPEHGVTTLHTGRCLEAEEEASRPFLREFLATHHIERAFGREV